jgi:hypothetical protein
MKTFLALLLLTPAIAVASSPFDGTWKMRLDSLKVSGKPDVFEVGNGTYACVSCVPAYKIKADGTDQPVQGQDYFDHKAVNVTGPSSVEMTNKKDGKVVSTASVSVSADGSTMTWKWKSNFGEKPTSGVTTSKRVAPGAPGANAMSGSWQVEAVTDASDLARTITLQSKPNGMKIVWNGQTTDAIFDGKEYPIVGDPGHTMVTLKKISDHEFEETDRRGGKVVDITVWTVSADGKTIQINETDPVYKTKSSYSFDKQP